MTDYGVTPKGWRSKPLEAIRSDVAGRLRAEIDEGLDLTAASAVGAHHLIITELVSQLWELGAGIYAAFNPSAARGDQLDALSSITGTGRRPARRSVARVTVVADQAVDLAPGDLVLSVESNRAVRFRNTDVVMTSGAANVAVAFEAEELGPLEAPAGTLTVIETPTSGIVAVSNGEDAVVGADIEGDESLRSRRERELDAVGSSTMDSVRAQLMQLPGVDEAIVLENDDIWPGASGLIRAVVLGGSTSEIAQAIWDHKGAGVQTIGAFAAQAKDNRGRDQTVRFDRAIEVPIYQRIRLVVDESRFPADGGMQVKQALVGAAKSLRISSPVIAEFTKGQAFRVSGVVDVLSYEQGRSASDLGPANLTMGEIEIARLDTGRVEVLLQ